MENQTNPYDVIIIGSGMSALSCASILSQMYKKRVLILEQHGKIGGFTHTFKRKAKYEWDVGLHYVGGMTEDKIDRMAFDFITRGELKWQKMPDPYDTFMYPGLTFEARKGEKNLENDLINEFPAEEKNIRQYFRDIKIILKWFGRYNQSLILPSWMKLISWLIKKPGMAKATMLTRDYLDHNFNDERLKAILVSQWGDYGLPPGKSALVIHMLIAHHYFEGGYYPIGGSKRISETIMPVIEEAGGSLFTRHRVEEILVQDDKAKGVRCLAGIGEVLEEKIFLADAIISAVGAYKTYKNLLPEKYGKSMVKNLKPFLPGISNVSLFIGLKEDPEQLGWKGGNFWIYDSFDHDDMYDKRNDLKNGKVRAAYVSFPSKKNPLASAHTMEVLVFVDYEPFAPWAEQPVKKRDEAYGRLKQKITEGIISHIEDRFPGFSNLIAYCELGTPLTNIHYTAHAFGNVYGIPGVPERYQSNVVSYRTPVKNLYLTGADTAGHGISGTLMSGLLTSAVMMGIPFHLIKIFSGVQKYAKKLKDE